MFMDKGSLMPSTSSHLSPLAPPFIVDRSVRKQSYASSPFVESLSGLSLYRDPSPSAPMESFPCHGAHTFEKVESNPYNSQYSSSTLHGNNNFISQLTHNGVNEDCLPDSSAIIHTDGATRSGNALDSSGLCYTVQTKKTHPWYGQANAKQRNFLSKDNNLLEQGLRAAESSRPRNVSSSDWHRDYKVNSFGYIAPYSKKPLVARNAEKEEVCQGLIRKGKDMKDIVDMQCSSTKNTKPIFGDSFLVRKSDQQVSSTNLRINTERCVSVKTSSEKSLEKFDEDLDSPCWKGALASHHTSTAVEVSAPVNSETIAGEIEEHKKLNPLAPQFFPGNAKETVNSVNSLYRGHGSGDPFKAVPVLLNKSSGFEEEYAFCGNSTSDTELYSTNMGKPNVVEDYFTSKGQFVTGDFATASAADTNFAIENGYCLLPPYDPECMLASSYYGASCSSELAEKTQGPSNFNSATQKLNVRMVVDTLGNLSDLLVQNCSSVVGSLNELDRVALEHVIKNLNVCIRKIVGQTNMVPDFGTLSSSDWLSKSTDFPKKTGTEFQERRIKTDYFFNLHTKQSDNCKRDSFSDFWIERDYKATASSSSCNDAIIEMAVDVNQVVDKVLGDDGPTERMPAQALLYKTLWLEAVGAICSTKRPV